MKYVVKSVCCKANVLPNHELKQLVCQDCGDQLGDTPWDNVKIIINEKAGPTTS